MKKLMAFLLALIMAFSLVTPAFADEGDPKPVKMNVRVADGSHYALPVDYIFSLENATRVANATVVFEVDGAMLEGGDLAFLAAGFSAMNPGDGVVTWTQKDNGIWQGELLVMYLGGPDGFNAVPETDIFKLSYRAKQLGDATLRVTEIRIVGFDDAGEPVFLADGPGGEARTVIARPDELYSVYDLNRDGVIDERDLAMAQRYYMVKMGDASWDAAQRCDFNADGQVDMLDLIDLFQNFGIAVPPDIAPGAITVSSLSAMELAAGEDGTVSITAVASNGQAVSLTAWSDDTDVATVSLSGGTLTVTAFAPGATAVSIIASAPNCLNVVRTFTVTVTEFTPGDESGLVKLAENHPNVTLLDQKEKTLIVTSGTKVSDLLAQVEFTDGAGSMKVVDWMDAEKNTPNLDMLVTGDRLIATQDEEEAEYIVEVPGGAPYWNDATYNSILTTVKENLPTFKDDVFNITDAAYADLIRAVTVSGGTKDDYTLVFRAAIADCTENGGGIVLVPADADPYYTGAIWLDNNVNLHVEEGATIEFIPMPANNEQAAELYPRALVSYEGIDFYGFSAPLYAYNKENIAVTGGGTIAYSNTGSWNGDRENYVYQWNYGKTPLELRDAFALNQKMACNLIMFYDSRNIILSDFTLGNAVMWSANLVLCENVLVRGITTTSTSSNSDGVNPESSRNIIIENNFFANQDDNIALKSGRSYTGQLRATPTERVIIRSNEFYRGTGISIGSEAAGGVNNIFVENNFWNGVDTSGAQLNNLFRIKYISGLTAVFENIFYRNIPIGGMREAIVSIERVRDNDMYNTPTGELQGTLLTVPTIRNIAFSNVYSVLGRPNAEARDSRFDLFIKAEIQDLRPITNFYMKDIDLVSSRVGTFMLVNNINNFNMDNVRVAKVSSNGSTVTEEYTYNTERTIELTDVTANGTALSESGKVDVMATGSNGTVVISGKVNTDIPNFETVGSVRVSYDIDGIGINNVAVSPSMYAIASLEKNAQDEIIFTATLTGVGAGIHNLAVVAKSNKLPHYVVSDNEGNRRTTDMVYHDVNTYQVDVEGTLRGMKVTFTYAPALTPFLNAPIMQVGSTTVITAVITDAKTGDPVTDATITFVGALNGIFTGSTIDGHNINMKANSAGRNHMTIKIEKDGYVSFMHCFRRVLFVADLATVIPN